MNRKCGPKKNNRAIKFFTARPNGFLRDGVGSVYLFSVIACGPDHLPSFLHHPAPHLLNELITQCIKIT